MLLDCGAEVIDADAISRQLTAPGGLAIRTIAAHFGNHFITAEGALNRDLMRQLAFTDAAARQKLENIIHPLIREETLRQTERASAAGRACLVFDVPLLVESGRWRQQVDQVLVVDCRETTQVERVMARNSFTREAVQQIMDGQATRARRLAAADICIYNDGLLLEPLSDLVRHVARRFGL